MSLPHAISAFILCFDTLVVPEGKTKLARAQFARQQIIGYLRRVVRHLEAQQAADAARTKKDAKADADVVIT